MTHQLRSPYVPVDGVPGNDKLTSESPTTLKLPAKPHAQVIYFFRVSNHLIKIDCSSMRRSEKL